MAPKEKEDRWTPLEKQIRDYLFWPLSRPLRSFPQTANCLTISGLLLLFYAIYDFFQVGFHEKQIWLLAAAWLTDLLDGPIARNNKQVTAFGTAADHLRDYLISFWMLVLGFVITARQPLFWPVYSILVLTLVGLLMVVAGTLLFAGEKRRERAGQPYRQFFQRFLLEDLVTSVTARIHTAILALGGVFYLAGFHFGEIYSKIGIVFLTVQLFLLGFYLHEIFQRRFEERTLKLRLALRQKIKELEEKLASRLKKR